MQQIIEILAVFAAFLSVYYSIHRNMLVWPTGLVSAVLYGILFYSLHLYGDAFLQIIFFTISLYGWIGWQKNREDHHKIVVNRLRNRTFLLIVGATILSIGGLAFGLAHYTNDSLPLMDAVITICSVMGQVLLCNRKIENWYFWLLTNVVSIDAYLLKGIYLTAFLYLVFFILCCQGLRRWKVNLSNSTQPVQAI